MCVCVCVCLRVTRVIGRGCLPWDDCWPHTQALPRQRCMVNNRRATTEGRHTQIQISIKVKDGCRRNGRALYRHVINTWGGFTTLEREAAERHVASTDSDICISNAWEVCMSQWQLSQYDVSRIAESGDSPLTCSHYRLSPFIQAADPVGEDQV